MRPETVQKNLNYKRALYLQDGGNLQTNLKAAIDKAKKVGSRKQIVNTAENSFLLLNSVRSRWSMLFGSMLIYSRGRNQPLVTEDDAADELEVEQIAPPMAASGARRDFVESLLFFGIKGNHVVLLQSSGLRARQLETHVNWLLQTKTKTIGEDDRIEIADHPSKSAIRQAMKSPVKKVTVGIPLESKSTTPRQETKRMSFTPEGTGFNVLRTILGHDWMNKVKLHESLDESRLKVEVLVSYTRATNPSGQELLNDIAIQLRHQEPEDVTIHLKNGARLTGDELKISGPISVTAYGGLVDPEDLFPRMRDWLATQIEDGVIEA